MKDNKNIKRLSFAQKATLTGGLTATGTILTGILGSFSNKAYAECFWDSNGFGCVDFDLTCLPEGTTQEVNVSLTGGYSGSSTPDGLYSYPLHFSLWNSGGVNLSISNPTSADFNGYDGTLDFQPTNRQGDGNITFTTNITAPLIDSRYDNPLTSTINFHSLFVGPDGGHPPYDFMVGVNGFRNVRIENVNTSPSLSADANLNGNNLTITANISDPESNMGVVMFEISDDPSFATSSYPELWYPYDDTSFEQSGTTLSHTFDVSNLENGTYYWRVAALEYGLDRVCVGTAYELDNRSFSLFSSDQFGIGTFVTGTLFLDYDKDGIRDDGEAGVGNVTLTFDSSGQIVSVLTSGDPAGSFYTEINPGSITLEVDGNDPDVPIGYYYNGPTSFTVSEGVENNLGDLPMITDEIAHLFFRSCYDPEENLFRFAFRADYMPGEYRLVGRNTGYILNLGYLEVGQTGGGFDETNTQYVLPVEDSWLKQWYNGTRWQRSGGIPETNIDNHTELGFTCPNGGHTPYADNETETTPPAPPPPPSTNPAPPPPPVVGGVNDTNEEDGQVLGATTTTETQQEGRVLGASTLSPTGDNTFAIVGISLAILIAGVSMLIKNLSQAE